MNESKTAAEPAVAAFGAASASKRFMRFPVVRGVVDDHVAAAQAVREIESFINVLGKNRHLQSVAGGIGKFDGLFIAVHRDDGNDGTERFFVVEQHLGAHVVNYRRLEKVIRSLFRQALAAEND